MRKMEILPILINFIVALVSVGAWLLNRRESKSRTDNFDVSTDKLRNEILDQLEAQFEKLKKKLIAENKELQAEIEALRTRMREKDEAYEIERNAKREELNNIKDQLVTVQQMNSAFITQFETMRAIDREKNIRIGDLERKNVELKTLVEQHTKILKKTG